MKHSLTIRMGAANWDAVLADGTRFDFRTMTTANRKKWYGAFMASCRKVYRQRGTR
ncbi:hypothetical protein HL667_06390 [Bradyrhizobium sp. 83012]|uniref:Uncharacterized protein n=1 Tax=Bradyrhizobium aeschynomenes TaxID=2734909 RepID=A0ABX2C8N3_9BRAD|nr:hypothetical protein [Bradyrhizobium aeschynomenes]NPU64621.1 hypothetical protein [Bradyrhizobium aeschynomenes]